MAYSACLVRACMQHNTELYTRARTGVEPRLGLHGGPTQSPAIQTPASTTAPASASGQQPAPLVDQASASASESADAAQGPASSAGRLPPPSPAVAAEGAASAGEPDPLGLGRPVLVYSRQALEAAEGGNGCVALGSATALG